MQCQGNVFFGRPWSSTDILFFLRSISHSPRNRHRKVTDMTGFSTLDLCKPELSSPTPISGHISIRRDGQNGLPQLPTQTKSFSQSLITLVNPFRWVQCLSPLK